MGYEKEEADKVGSSDGVGAAGTLESFRNLIVERSVTVSSWRTLTLSSNFVIPLFLFLSLDSRNMTLLGLDSRLLLGGGGGGRAVDFVFQSLAVF